MDFKIPSTAGDVPEYQADDSVSTPEAPNFEKTIKAWQSTIELLRAYKTELGSIVQGHPDLTPEHRTFIAKGLVEVVESSLTDAEAILADDASEMPVFLAISSKMGSAKVVLLMKGADLEMVETDRCSSLGSALARLRRTEDFYSCMKQLRELRDANAYQIFGDDVGADLLERMLGKGRAVKLGNVKTLSMSEGPDNPQKLACVVCHETVVKTLMTRCRSMILWCCGAPVHGCCIALRLRGAHTTCPGCSHAFSEEEMAAMIHERTYQLDEELRTYYYEKCGRQKSAVESA